MVILWQISILKQELTLRTHISQFSTLGKAQPRVGPVQSVGQTNQILAMSTSNEQAYREMLLLLQGESKITDELAPIDGDADEIPDGRVTADSLCSSALLLLADPDQVSYVIFFSRFKWHTMLFYLKLDYTKLRIIINGNCTSNFRIPSMIVSVQLLYQEDFQPFRRVRHPKAIKEDIIEQEDPPCKQIQYGNFMAN